MSMTGTPTEHFRWNTPGTDELTTPFDFGEWQRKLDEDMFRIGDKVRELDELTQTHTEQITDIYQQLAITIETANQAKATADKALSDSATAKNIAKAAHQNSEEAKTLAAHAEEVANAATCLVDKLNTAVTNLTARVAACENLAQSAYNLAVQNSERIGLINNQITNIYIRLEKVEEATEVPPTPNPTEGRFNWIGSGETPANGVLLWRTDPANSQIRVSSTKWSDWVYTDSTQFGFVAGWRKVFSFAEIPGIVLPSSVVNVPASVILYGNQAGTQASRINPNGDVEIYIPGGGTIYGYWQYQNFAFPITVTG